MLAGSMTHPGSVQSSVCTHTVLPVAMTLDTEVNNADCNRSCGILLVPGSSFKILVDRIILG